jgi:hypothetical protein
MVFTPHFDASWQHEFLDQSRGITSNPGRDSALLETGLDAELNKAVTVFEDYTVQPARKITSANRCRPG